MAILNRVTRLFRADAHAVLDALEEPEALLKQAIREMQDALDKKRAALRRSEKILSEIRRREDALSRSLDSACSDLNLALERGSEELARKSIARKLSYTKRLNATRDRAATLEKLGRDQRSELDQQLGELESVREKAQAFVPLSDPDSPFSVANSILDSQSDRPQSLEVTDEEVELEWLRLQNVETKGSES